MGISLLLGILDLTLVAVIGPRLGAVGVLEGTVTGGTTVTTDAGQEMLTAAEMIETRTAETDAATVVVTDTATETTMTGTTAEAETEMIEAAMTIGGGRHARTQKLALGGIFYLCRPRSAAKLSPGTNAHLGTEICLGLLQPG